MRIKPSGKRLPTAPLGRSDELQVGDWVIAIGNAVGLAPAREKLMELMGLRTEEDALTHITALCACD